jgi:predicted nucleotidyltransferase
MGDDPGESRRPLFPSRVETLVETLRMVSGVNDVKLAGSAAAGDRTPLSDWDFELDLNDERVLDALEHALQRLTVLALFWDPLSARATPIVIMDGPIKVDVIVPAMRNPHPMSRWTVTAETLPRIDAHFWDWTLYDDTDILTPELLAPAFGVSPKTIGRRADARVLPSFRALDGQRRLRWGEIRRAITHNLGQQSGLTTSH